MANITLQALSARCSAAPTRVSVPVLGVSLLLCMLLGFVAPEWGLHRPWLQFFPGLTGFDLQSSAPGLLQSLVFGGYAGALTAAIFNVVSPRFG
ncbi:hypothetical protein [Rhizobium lusitanum]|jgi:hypothetical protein|uniref:hypothetical protein n=1 Tax=Rhizobium lusitanum TaxID=293958 RepID=UPI00055BA361|nr:hypothetical protein [Rhizobium lusitanum]NTJ11358.1 hypothetical protein [Rhizobium lusitanum]